MGYYIKQLIYDSSISIVIQDPSRQIVGRVINQLSVCTLTARNEA